MKSNRLRKALLLSVCVGALASMAAVSMFRPGIWEKVRELGIRRTVEKGWNRVRREGLVATLSEALGHSRNTVAASTSTLTYSLYDLQALPPVEDSAARAALPETIDVPPIDPAQLESSLTEVREYKTWHRSGGDEMSSKFSSLDQINVRNVHNLRPAWSYTSGSDLGDSTKTGGLTVETNPIVAAGRLFTTTIDGDLVSLEANTGKEIWRLALPGPVARRGLVWEPNPDFSKSRLFVPSAKGVFAVNAATGNVINSFGKAGAVGSGTSLIAPLIIGHQLVIATLAPALESYSLETGRRLWVRPLLAETDSLTTRLTGGVPWGGMSADIQRQTVFVVTGNPRPALLGSTRPGKNAYSCSLIAVDSRTGAVRWSFQEVEHDLWDLDLSAAPLLTTISLGRKRVDVVAAVTKRGNTVLLDRDQGQPIFGYTLRRTPVSTIPGERTAPYQPVFELPEPFAKQEFTRGDISQISASAQRTVSRKLRSAVFGFFQPPRIGGAIALFGLHGGAEWPGGAIDPNRGVLYVPSNQIPWLIRTQYSDVKATAKSGADLPANSLYMAKCAQCHGAARAGMYEWEGTGDGYIPALTGITLLRRRDQLESKVFFEEWHQDRRVVASSTQDLQSLYSYFEALDKRADAQRSFALNAFWQLVLDDAGNPASNPPWGLLTALDLNSGRKLWQIPFGENKAKGKDMSRVRGLQNIGGVVATAGGLLFATGTTDNELRAFDSSTGDELWSYKLPAAGSTFPTVYEVDGRQYVVVVATGGGFRGFSGRSDRVIAFALPNRGRD